MRWDKNFFARVRGNIIKWWQQVCLPVLHINNNEWRQGRSVWKKQKEDDYAKESEDTHSSLSSGTETTEETGFGGENSAPEDALEVLNRIQREKEQERQREIEKAKQQADEKDRVASIMNANKVDVNAFIEAGKAAIQDNSKEEETKASDEEMRKAQEIIERLNREAAEDEAKKQAEIDAAKQMAKETFG